MIDFCYNAHDYGNRTTHKQWKLFEIGKVSRFISLYIYIFDNTYLLISKHCSSFKHLLPAPRMSFRKMHGLFIELLSTLGRRPVSTLDQRNIVIGMLTAGVMKKQVT